MKVNFLVTVVLNNGDAKRYISEDEIDIEIGSKFTIIKTKLEEVIGAVEQKDIARIYVNNLKGSDVNGKC